MNSIGWNLKDCLQLVQPELARVLGARNIRLHCLGEEEIAIEADGNRRFLVQSVRDGLWYRFYAQVDVPAACLDFRALDAFPAVKGICRAGNACLVYDAMPRQPGLGREDVLFGLSVLREAAAALNNQPLREVIAPPQCEATAAFCRVMERLMGS